MEKPSASRGGLVQDLRDFTVQIRHSRTDAIVGAGVLVAPDRVVTCAHVLADAGVDPQSGLPTSHGMSALWRFRKPADPRSIGPGTVTVRLIDVDKDTSWTGVAQLLHRFDDSDDDIVVLRIVGEGPLLRPNQQAVLGRAALAQQHPFRSFGFPEIGEYEALRVDGVVGGTVPAPNLTLHADRVQLKTDQIAKPGMSGAPVLDEQLNLVVGLLAESRIPSGDVMGPGVAWAVDSRVLALKPFELPVLARELPRRPVPTPPIDPAAVLEAAVEAPGAFLREAPDFDPRWVLRTPLLNAILGDTQDPDRRMVGLVGFGGEGKTTLAAAWMHEALNDERRRALFWWTFDKPDVDQFFAAAFSHLTQGSVDLGEGASTSQRMAMLSALIRARPYTFVLDGLEVLQRREGPGFGRIVNHNLAEFLRHFAASTHASFCLLTSRLPVADLIDVPSAAYRERHVGRLTREEGRELLRAKGVRGAAADLDAVVEVWAGHALTLSLVGGLIASHYGGDIARGSELPVPVATANAHERLSNLLAFYDRHLTEEERAFLMVLSSFRAPIDDSWFSTVFRSEEARAVSAPLIALSDDDLTRLLSRLVDLSVLAVSLDRRLYGLHPLLRQHYLALLEAASPEARRSIHTRIYRRYLELGSDVGIHATLKQLAPLIEAVHHACRAERHEEALALYRTRLEGDEMHLSYQLNAYDTVSSLMDGFFSHGEHASSDPALPDLSEARYVINRKGVSLMNTGRLREASGLFKRAIEFGRRAGDILGAAQSAQNLSEVSIYLGRIAESAEAARHALALAKQLDEAQRVQEVRDCYCYRGWAASLAGNDDDAGQFFDEAERIQQELDPEVPFLLDIWGIAQAEFLRRHGEHQRARAVADANMRYAQDEGLIDDVSICHRVLARLDADEGVEHRRSAMDHLDEAVRIARSIAERTVLLEALTARGCAHAKWGNASKAVDDLEEALQYAKSGGYALLEVDVHVGRAARLARLGDRERAEAEVAWCRQQAARLNYAWGRRDAEEVARGLEADAW